MAQTRNLISVIPFILVGDLQRSRDFFRDVLGFSVLGHTYKEDRPVHCYIERDGVLLELHQAEGGDEIEGNRKRASDVHEGEASLHVVDLSVRVRDVHALRREIVDRGGRIIKEPTEEYMPRMIVEGVEGYAIGFVQDPSGA